jgi:hypothetical protein
MFNEPSVPVTAKVSSPKWDRSFYHSLGWPAVLAGTVAAIGINLLLSALGVGAGLATFTPLTDADPVAHFNAGAGLVWTLCATVALGFGGLIAGRFSRCLHAGFVHGILVWSLTLIITLLFLSLGTGLILGGAMKVLGEGLGIGSRAVATGEDDLAKAAAWRNNNLLASFIQEAAQSVPTNAEPKAVTRAQREVGLAVTKLFAPGDEANMRDHRVAAIQVLMNYTQMSEVDSTKTVDEWIAADHELQTQLELPAARAEQTAREAADLAARHLSHAAIWSFFALLIGLLAAAFGARFGARSALRHADFLETGLWPDDPK